MVNYPKFIQLNLAADFYIQRTRAGMYGAHAAHGYPLGRASSRSITYTNTGTYTVCRIAAVIYARLMAYRAFCIDSLLPLPFSYRRHPSSSALLFK